MKQVVAIDSVLVKKDGSMTYRCRGLFFDVDWSLLGLYVEGKGRNGVMRPEEFKDYDFQ